MKTMNNKGVIYIWFVAGVTIVLVYSLIWYVLNAVVQATITNLYNMYPGTYNSDVITFMRNIWTYSPALMIFLSLLPWIYLKSQKERAESFEYS